MSFIFKSKIIILYLTRSKHVNSQHASTFYTRFLARYNVLYMFLFHIRRAYSFLLLVKILSDVINLYMVMTLPYMVIPLITYLVSPVQNASKKKTNSWSFFFLGPPCVQVHQENWTILFFYFFYFFYFFWVKKSQKKLKKYKKVFSSFLI